MQEANCMTCNLEKYLEEQELSCRRIAKSANDGTQSQSEWEKTATVFWERRREHIKVCKKCSKESK
jgi:hypothetical protein